MADRNFPGLRPGEKRTHEWKGGKIEVVGTGGNPLVCAVITAEHPCGMPGCTNILVLSTQVLCVECAAETALDEDLTE